MMMMAMTMTIAIAIATLIVSVVALDNDSLKTLLESCLC